MGDYEAFLEGKRHAVVEYGFAPLWMPDFLYPFQRAMVDWSLRRGRAALFADCGLGKTPMQLVWAQNVAQHTGKPVLIVAPLAVSQQTIREGEKFGVPVSYARTQSEVVGSVVITNYERIENFDPSSFGGVVLDESSILKSYMGKTKRYLLAAFAGTPYRLCCTATPAPNDHMELGNHCEFLGIMTSNDMIARWFINDTSTFGTYRVKHYAASDFWRWVASWARCVGLPSDIDESFSDDGFVLPEMNLSRHIVEVDVVDGRGDNLFRVPDMSATAVHKERRRTAAVRAECIAGLIRAEPEEQWVVWCDTNYEADALTAAIDDCSEVRGNEKLEHKERKLEQFTDGSIRVLVTKPSISGYGLNWQHCARVAFVGPMFSYEQYYQATRRTWRFGQPRSVDVHMAMAQTEVDVWSVLLRKEREHNEMQESMFNAMRSEQRMERDFSSYKHERKAEVPAWL